MTRTRRDQIYDEYSPSSQFQAGAPVGKKQLFVFQFSLEVMFTGQIQTFEITYQGVDVDIVMFDYKILPLGA